MPNVDCCFGMHPPRSRSRGEWADPVSSIQYLVSGGRGRGTLCNKEDQMKEHSLTIGANLLLWVFPLALVLLVVAEDILDRCRRDPGQ